jgi:aminomethyltransferase
MTSQLGPQEQQQQEAQQGHEELLRTTRLHQWHIANGARMGGFAGYDMPIRYEPGTIAEHIHTRTSSGLFDVSHMGVAEIRSASGLFADVAEAFERFVPCDVQSIAPGRQRYTQLLNDDGGIIDDLMIARPLDEPAMLSVVSNAGRKHVVFPHLQVAFPSSIALTERPDIALIALQGPASENVLCELTNDTSTLRHMKFMDVGSVTIGGVPIGITRSGYTGEDGFELAIHEQDLDNIISRLMENDSVRPAGLGARDTLRLEAGLCLYGSDIDETTSPIEAGLLWSIQKRRRTELGFPGAARIAREIENGPTRKLVALAPEGKSLVRDHAPLLTTNGEMVGAVTSGGFGPTLGRPIAMGYVAAAQSSAGSSLIAEVRGKHIAVEVVTVPFVPHTYRR